MKLKKFKEENSKKVVIVVFTIACILLISGVILYRTFAIFETNNNLNMIKGNVQDTGDIEFAFYIDGTISKNAPKKEEGYSLDTSSSYCKDVLNDTKVSNVNWNDENWSVEIKGVSTTKTKCYLYFKQIYKEPILNGAIPDLGNGRLIPVTISNTEKPTGVEFTDSLSVGGKVYKADITDQENPWYSYENHKWANAVILKNGIKDHYKAGEEILESEIESYFVWIPRYRYQLFTDNPNQFNNTEYKGKINNNSTINDISKKINVVFESKDADVSSGNTKDSWLTHPAFLSFDTDGFWVGKFETGYNGDISPGMSVTNVIDVSKVIIRPNTNSWIYIQVANAFYNSYDYKRDLESHMMKNMEWGAVAYLTYSKYGVCNDTDCSIVRLNNVSYVSGYSANEEPTCGTTDYSSESCHRYETVTIGKNGLYSYTYYDQNSQKSSTTGNYSGIYDMAGGAGEYVMGIMQYSKDVNIPASGRNELYNSGFKGPYSCPTCDNLGSGASTELTNGLPWPSSKYYDLYDYSDHYINYYLGKLGDATKEMGPFFNAEYEKVSTSPGTYGYTVFFSSWNHDNGSFVTVAEPWIQRGMFSFSGTAAGVFAFSNYDGSPQYYTFRIVLSP